MSRPSETLQLKPVAEIAEETGMTVAAVTVCLARGVKKLRRSGLLVTARELAQALDANRKGIIE
jgi:hypothetical protein